MNKRKMILIIFIFIALIFIFFKFRCGNTAFYIYNIFTKTVTVYGIGEVNLTKGIKNAGYVLDSNFENDYEIAEYKLTFPKATKKIIIKNGITRISENPYCYSYEMETPYKGLTEIVLPNSVKEFEKGSFADLKNLEKINIPDSVKIIPEYCFYNCDKLKDVEFSDNIRIIEECAFYKCASLSKVKLNNIRYIGRKAFQNCYNLEEINIYGDINDFLAYTFDGCFNLTTVNLTPNIKYCDSGTFRNCKKLNMQEIKNKIEIIDHYKTDYIENMKELENIKKMVENEK